MEKTIYIKVLISLILSSIFLPNMQAGKFGKQPSGERKERIIKSPNYKNGSFQNQSNTPVLSEGVSYFSVTKEFLFGKSKRVSPVNKIPSTKTDLLQLDINKDILVWSLIIFYTN